MIFLGIEKDEIVLQNLKKDIAEIQSSDGEIIMLDECLFNQKQVLNRAWMVKGANLQPEVIWPQQKCFAVLAAISNKRGLLHFYFREKSIKSDDYVDFLIDLRHMTPN